MIPVTHRGLQRTGGKRTANRVRFLYDDLALRLMETKFEGDRLVGFACLVCICE